LSSSSMNDSQFDIVSDEVDSLPQILFDIEGFNFLNVVKSVLITNSSFWSETFTANNENKLFVELTNAERLSWLFKVRKHNPFLTGDREELTAVQTLNEWSSTDFVFSVCHSTQNIDVIFELVNDMISSWIEHVVKWFQERSVLIKLVSIVKEFLGGWVESTNHKDITFWSDNVSAHIWNIEFI